MKKTVYLLCALLFAAFTFFASPAKAQVDMPCNGGDPVAGTGCDVPSSSTNLPINSGTIYLLIAGLVVGIVTVKKQRAAIYKA